VTDWLTKLPELAASEPVAMVSVLASEGSAPRGAGTRMLVTATGQSGTIGGGNLEYQAAQQARSILALPAGSWRVQDYPLGPLLGQCCGGRVRLLVEHVDPAALGWLAQAASARILITQLHPARIERQVCERAALTALPARGDLPAPGAEFAEVIAVRRRPLYLFGAGHVGQAVARHAANLPFQLAWFDTRPELEALPGVTIVDEPAITQCIAEAPEEAAVLILTHDHGLDYALTSAALARARLAYIGLIGSATKRARFVARWRHEGVSDAALARLTCPIGIAGIVGKEPDVIAVAALAQLLQLGAP
jgi:xanthine dehydrogenase accessory factor